MVLSISPQSESTLGRIQLSLLLPDQYQKILIGFILCYGRLPGVWNFLVFLRVNHGKGGRIAPVGMLHRPGVGPS